jgi:formylglycine-generating enzyme required for sulfatase activity
MPPNDASADTFGSGANSFEIEFLTIGNPGNPADATGRPIPAGSVPYVYRIGKYEISRSMIEKANADGGLNITLADMTLFSGNGPNKPAAGINWFAAARFVNWLNAGTGNSPAYKFEEGFGFRLWEPGDPGYDPSNLYRNSLARYFLPSVDEWYKAAYFDPATGVYYDYPTGANSVPTSIVSGTAAGSAVYGLPQANGPADVMSAGGLSPYGTMAQGGNVQEWEETDFDLANDNSSSGRGLRGGYWNDNVGLLSSLSRLDSSAANDSLVNGLRVASAIPEPNSFLLSACVTSTFLLRRRTFPRHTQT